MIAARTQKLEVVDARSQAQARAMLTTGVPTHRRRTQGWWVIGLAVLALAVVLVSRPMQSPPLYDGLGFPDEPYRWVQAPAGAPGTAAVTPASMRVKIGAGGAVPEGTAQSAEQGPQVSFAIGRGALKAPGGAGSLTVSAVAGPKPDVAPPDGVLVSNLYRLTGEADVAGPVTLAAGKHVVVSLRADRPTRDSVVMETYQDGAWSQVLTWMAGADVHAAELESFAQIALVRLPPGQRQTVQPTGTTSAVRLVPEEPPGTSRSTASRLYLVSAGIVLALLAGLLLLLRRRMRTSGPPLE